MSNTVRLLVQAEVVAVAAAILVVMGLVITRRFRFREWSALIALLLAFAALSNFIPPASGVLIAVRVVSILALVAACLAYAFDLFRAS